METNTFLVPERTYATPTTFRPYNNLNLRLEEENQDEFEQIEREKIIDDQDPDGMPPRKRDETSRTGPSKHADN